MDILKGGRRLIEQIPGTRIDYLELVDAETIEPGRAFPVQCAWLWRYFSAKLA